MKRLLLIILTIISIDTTYAQDQPKTLSAADVKKMADDKKIQFTAKVAVLGTNGSPTSSAVGSEPTQDNRITLTESYYVSLKPDSVVSFLPYFDKTKTEGTGVDSKTTTEQDPTKSAATVSDYSVKQNKKQHVIATVKPNDGSKITKYVFDLAPDGTGKVEVTIEDYKIITYEGSYNSL